MKQKINTGITGSPGRFARPRFCLFADCGVAITGYKYCPEHARKVTAEKKVEARRNARKRNRKVRQSKVTAERRMGQAALEALSRIPRSVKSSDILHAPPEKAARMIDAILAGRMGLA